MGAKVSCKRLLVGALLAPTAIGWAAEPPRAALIPPEEITGEELAAWVLDDNPGLAALRAAAEAAHFGADVAGSLPDPMFSYGAAPRTAGSEDGFKQTFTFAQKLPWPGTLAAQKAAARWDAKATDGDVEALRLEVATLAKAAHAEWVYVAEALATLRSTRVLLDELIGAAEARYAAGRARKQDVLQAEVERAELNDQELRLRRQQVTVRARINALLNRDPDTQLPQGRPLRVAATLPASDRIDDLALARHPELQRLEAHLGASKNRVTLAEKAFYPDVELGVGYDGMWDEADQRPMIAVTVNVPINRSRRHAELDRAQAETRQSHWALAERRALLLAELARARAEVAETQASVKLHQEELLPLADEYLQAALDGYQSGGGDFLSVINAEQRKLTAELSLARARADYATRLAELERWAGGRLDPAAIAVDGR